MRTLPMVSFAKYVATLRRFDRDSLIRGAGWASAQNNGSIFSDGQASAWLPWNIAGMAVTAICRGTPHGPAPDIEELRVLIALFSNIDDGAINDQDSALRGLERLIHEQMPYQHHAHFEWSRGQALFVETIFPPAREPEVMKGAWVEAMLGGATIAEYSSTGFIMLASALASNGIFDPATVWDSSLSDLLAVLPRERIEAVGRAHYVTTVDGIKRARRDVPSLDKSSDKYAFNPLVARPFVEGVVPGAWIAPSTDLVGQKLGIAGISFLGIDKWGTKFTRDLGTLFEAYVGRHLGLIDGATVLGEVPFGRRTSPQKSTDWFVITDSVVVLIEVKASSPNDSIRQSAGDMFSGVKGKLGAAVTQLNKTAAAIATERGAFSFVPTDLPVVGLVVTLGNFPSASLAYRMGQLGTSAIPISFVNIGELEALVTLTADELSAALLKGFKDSDVPGLIENMGRVIGHSPTRRNAILDEAWLSNPVMRYLKKRADR